MQECRWNGDQIILKNLKHLVVGLVSLLIIIVNNSCNHEEKKEVNYVVECSDPWCELIIQPYGNFSKNIAKSESLKLKKQLEENLGITVRNITILSNKNLSKEFLNYNKTRYSANKIVKDQLLNSTSHKVVIGLTDKDISTAIRGKKDWGIQGLAILGANTCIVSTYRLNKNTPLWKPLLHEFLHTFMKMHHCKNDNPNCIMQDGHGKPNWYKKNNLCETCKKITFLY